MTTNNTHFSPPRTIRKERKLLGGGPGDIPIIHTLYDTYVEWSELTVKFPKTQRFALGERVSGYLLDATELLISAASTSNVEDKMTNLQLASAKVDLTKLLVRLSKDTKSISNTQYLQAESRLIDAGKMLGGWLKSLE